jgi:hypothetical protein
MPERSGDFRLFDGATGTRFDAPPAMMAYRLTCPKCHRSGVVRSERIVVGHTAVTHYSCGECLHEWEGEEPPPPHNPPERAQGRGLG